MSQPKGFRRSENLPPGEKANHDRMASEVVWETLVAFDREASDDPEDHGDLPYEPGNSLMDRERRGSVSVLWSARWSGGIRLVVDDGDAELVEVMLDRPQVYVLATGIFRWLSGRVPGWERKPVVYRAHCRACKGTGIRAKCGKCAGTGTAVREEILLLRRSGDEPGA